MKPDRDTIADTALQDPSLYPVQMIPVDRIRVKNPRSRDGKAFRALVENIAKVGLKRPIRVSAVQEGGETIYTLACGQGRVEAFIALGQAEIPAQVASDDPETQLLISLAENIARRLPLRFEHIQQIKALKDRGYSAVQIAEKINLSDNYISELLHLWEHGEERLLRAVEVGSIPVSVATEIARASDEEAQAILVSAYESKKLRGKSLLQARRILETRRTYGKRAAPVPSRRKTPSSADALARAYQQEVRKQKLLAKKAKLSESRLLFIATAMRQLLADEHFRTLLRAENLDSLPRHLAERAGFRPSSEKGG